MHVRSRAPAARFDFRSPFFRSELFFALIAAWILVILRGAVFVGWEQSFFDSDQAIVGLMAKHLAEGRAFPLFYYGQTYMLGVDAWIAAPVFLVFGPTVGALHLSLLLVNLAVTTVIVVGLERWGALRPWYGLAASVFFTFAPPVTARSLIEAGANIGPFLYVPLLWMWRRFPLRWGVVLAVGFLHREFTIYALPALLLADVLSSGRSREAQVRQWLVGLTVALACWQGIQALKPYADLMGPGTRGELIGGFGGSQGGNIADRVSLAPSEWPERIRTMFIENLPRLYGTRRVAEPSATQGHDWMQWPLALALAAAATRALWLSRTWRDGNRAAFGWYLAGVGATAVAAYIATRPSGGMVDRYLLLTLFLPVGIAAVLLALEPHARVRHALVALLVVWSVNSAVDHTRLLARYLPGTESNEIRDLADGLVARGIVVAEADYWRAYKLTFLARERVKVGSIDFIRIEEYRRLADGQGPALIRIEEHPCEGGEPLSLWYLCPAGR